MQSVDPSILLRTLDGYWEEAGTGRLRGIIPLPDSLLVDVDDGGPRACSFTLLRDPRVPSPDLSAWTPCKISMGGPTVWRGRVRETPSRDGQQRHISVQGEGMQYHLEDDTYRPFYVHTTLADWKDRRSHPTTQLGSGFSVAAGQVSNEGGTQLSFPHNTTVQINDEVGVMLDLGPGQEARRWVITVTTSANNNVSPQALFYLASGPNASGAASTGLYGGAALTTVGAGPTTIAVSPPAGSRYLFAVLYWGSAGTSTNDAWVKVLSSKVFASTAYESGNASILKPDTVAKDARDKATKLLSSSNALVDAMSFSLPEFYATQDRNAREVGTAMKAYGDIQFGVDAESRLIFRDRNAAANGDLRRPTLEIGDWSGVEFEDASMNSGRDIYSRVVIEGQGSDGSPIRMVKNTGALSEYRALDQVITNPNPSFATDTTGWTDSSADVVILRVTDDFDTGPASGRVDTGAGTGAVNVVQWVQSPNFVGTFLAGQTYILRIWVKNPDTRVVQTRVRFGDQVAGDTVLIDIGDGGTTTVYHRDVEWTPTANRTAVQATVFFTPTAINISGALHVDSLTVYKATKPTLPERRGFIRTKVLQVPVAVTLASAEQLGETFLRAHDKTPFKGDLVVSGQGGVRRSAGGAGVHPAHLLLEYGKVMRFTDRVDPDTGGWGRVGRIASVAYKHADQSASVAIDNQSGNFEALLARYALVVGQVR